MKNLSLRLFLGIGVFALIVIALELSGYICLQHFNVDGSYDNNSGIGNKLRRYLLNPADTTVQLWYLPRQTLGFTYNPLHCSCQNNFNTLVSEIVRDSVRLYVLSFALNNTGEDLDNGIPGYFKLNEMNNTILLDVCKTHGGTWVPVESDSISPEHWLSDDCHLNESGNAFTAPFVSRYLNILQ